MRSLFICLALFASCVVVAGAISLLVHWSIVDYLTFTTAGAAISAVKGLRR